jgi:hypothetical protein
LPSLLVRRSSRQIGGGFFDRHGTPNVPATTRSRS